MQNKIAAYLKVCEKSKGLSELTLKAYRIDLRQFQEYMMEKDYLAKDNLVSYINEMHSKYKPKSAKRKIACIKAFYHYLEVEDIIDYNPFHKIVLKYKEPVVLPRIIPLEYVSDILKHAYNVYSKAKTDYQKEVSLRNIVIVEFLFSTGMRVSEISHMKKSDLNLSSGNIRILGKGLKERIMCIANSDILSITIKYTLIHEDSEYMFINRLGNRLSEQSIRNMVNNYAKAASVPLHVTPHMFRHTFATELHNEDVDIQYIQQLLGHSSITTTQIYSHISTNKIRNILESKHPRNKFDYNNLFR